MGSYWRFYAALILGCMVINPAVGYAEDLDPKPPLDAPIDDQADDEETETEKAAQPNVTRDLRRTQFDEDYEFARKLIAALDHVRNVTLFAGVAGAFIGLFLMWFFARLAPAGAWWQWVMVLVLAVGSQHAAQRYYFDKSEVVQDAIYGGVEIRNKSAGRITVSAGHVRDLSDRMRDSISAQNQAILKDELENHREMNALIADGLVRVDRFKNGQTGRFHSAWFLKYGLGIGGLALILLILTSIITRRVPGLAG